ncbi:MAG: c-type cytochrome [Steroidobacteraceae bacterium]
MKMIIWLLGLLVLVALGTGAIIWSGAYNIAADDPHWRVTEKALEEVRDRSIAARASGADVPDLADESLIQAGAGNYDAMCDGCHLEPGEDRSELSLGLYPAPPDLTRERIDSPEAAFWVIKHGIKLTGMPAWGKSMDDESIWGMVAFLQQLPGMSSDRYEALVESSGGHSHGPGESDAQEEHDEVYDHTDSAHLHVPDAARAAAETVDRFYAALSAGELDRAGAELDRNVIILESGGGEHSAAEYLGHHAREDAEFLKTVQQKLLSRTAGVSGDFAWVASESELRAQQGGKPKTILSTETMVLRTTDAGWKIVHIHWSSRPAA